MPRIVAISMVSPGGALSRAAPRSAELNDRRRSEPEIPMTVAMCLRPLPTRSYSFCLLAASLVPRWANMEETRRVKLDFVNHKDDPDGWARELGIPREAVDLYLASDVIDLHVDSFIWTRVFGYDLTTRHDHGLFGARIYS